MSAERVERYLHRHGLAASKSRSQNHLVDSRVLEEIVELADPPPGRHILEIGPGLGILTGALLDRGAAVTAVEVDPRLVGHLRARFAEAGDGSLSLIEANALDVPVADLVEPPYDVVANLPYHITSPVLHHMLGNEPRPDRFVLMLQREVAERIAAAPGGMSYLSVFVQYHAEVRVARIVPASAFEPAPVGRVRGPGRRGAAAAAGARRARSDCGGSSRPASASGERCSTTSCRASCRTSGASGSWPRSTRWASTRRGGRRRSASRSGWRSRAALGPLD